MTEVLLASFLVMLVSLSGKLITWRGIGPLIERNLHFLVSSAAGVLLVVAWNLSFEIVEEAGSFAAGLPWIAIGAVVVLIAFQYVPQFHHHHEEGEQPHSRIDANRVLASDAIHNIGDGIVIVVSFAASSVIGVASTLSIMVHELLQEISEFFVLREAGLPVRTALVWNFITSSSILIGTLGSFFLLAQFQALEVPLLGLSVGAYLVVVFNDLLPHSLSGMRGGRHILTHLLFFAAGLAIMFVIVTLIPEVKPEGDESIALIAAHEMV
ncbi:MAG: ZIP family metal transporter [Candidatus Kaiserbacteria bacterium]|nr:MAG: ZIP family metal transporter [Candidatus Kaiserbacteria bacterium]